MKLAIIGSRGLSVTDFSPYIPEGTDEIISGGAKGIDSSAAEYARSHGIKLTEILPDYARYGRVAPLKRNDEIVALADEVLAFWDGESRGTAYVIKKCEKAGKVCRVVRIGE